MGFTSLVSLGKALNAWNLGFLVFTICLLNNSCLTSSYLKGSYWESIFSEDNIKKKNSCKIEKVLQVLNAALGLKELSRI